MLVTRSEFIRWLLTQPLSNSFPVGFDIFKWGFEEKDTILTRLTKVTDNAASIMRGIHSGYLTAAYELTNSAEPTAAQPLRNHVGWPYLHCLCHCTTTADIGEKWSIWAGLNDEIVQTNVIDLFDTLIFPMIITDVKKRPDPKQALGFVMRYLFGDPQTAQKSIILIGLSEGRKERERLEEAKQQLTPIIDAFESAWQASDFSDNTIGREGGCQCRSKGLHKTNKNRFTFCKRYCADRGITSTTPEGPGTSRPWGPHHPLNPGPIPLFDGKPHVLFQKRTMQYTV